MVTSWKVNWEQHKLDIYNQLCKSKGPKFAKRFIDFYASRYDKFKRTFIDWKFAVELYRDYKHVKRNMIAWYAIVGEGGVGKTNVAKNAAYFLDMKFIPSTCMTDSMEQFINILKGFDANNAMRSAILDEPDTAIAPNSQEARVIRPVFGKARQQKLFLFFCATDMADIPNFIYKKLNRIIFCASRNKSKGKALLFKDKPKLKRYYLGKLKKDYMDKLSYEVFFDYAKKAKHIHTKRANPFTNEEEATYLQNKQNDYISTLDTASKQLGKVNYKDKQDKKDERIMVMEKLQSRGFTLDEIGGFYNLTKSAVCKILKNVES